MPAEVAELQGLYGAFTFSEKLLQKIWLRGDFQRASARTTDGIPLRVVHPGKWNLLGGPDFTGARVRFGGDTGRESHGDVEVHVHAADWDAHEHARDPAYDRVMLHVVLFPPREGRVTRGGQGRVIPTLALLPLLHRGLEEFAADEVVEGLAHRPLARLPESLGRLPEAELRELLRRHALLRWEMKTRFARIRIERLGWDDACHCTALEILGYRFNRAPMMRLATQWPLTAWAERAVTADDAFVAEQGFWSVQGVRPANHPRTRLRQYAQWTSSQPGWPAHLAAQAEELPSLPMALATPEARRHAGLPELRQRWCETLTGGAVGGTRFDTLVCDGFLPLAAARDLAQVAPWWAHWYPGDLPHFLRSGLRQLGFFDGRERPAAHGAAQGLLGWYLHQEAEARSEAPPCP